MTGSDRKERLVCELMQLPGRAPAPIARACVNDPAWAPDDSVGGWCYSTKPEVVGETCQRRGAPGTLRFFGAAEPRTDSVLASWCER